MTTPKKKRGRPRSSSPRSVWKSFRLTAQESARIRILAELYAGGDESKWLRYAALNVRRRFLK
jgi:hypothetical protein